MLIEGEVVVYEMAEDSGNFKVTFTEEALNNIKIRVLDAMLDVRKNKVLLVLNSDDTDALDIIAVDLDVYTSGVIEVGNLGKYEYLLAKLEQGEVTFCNVDITIGEV